jgi:hypothetical protein
MRLHPLSDLFPLTLGSAFEELTEDSKTVVLAPIAMLEPHWGSSTNAPSRVAAADTIQTVRLPGTRSEDLCVRSNGQPGRVVRIIDEGDPSRVPMMARPRPRDRVRKERIMKIFKTMQDVTTGRCETVGETTLEEFVARVRQERQNGKAIPVIYCGDPADNIAKVIAALNEEDSPG